MNSCDKTALSKFSQEALEALNKAVSKELERKRKLGHYAVIWDGEKPVLLGADAPVEKDESVRDGV